MSPSLNANIFPVLSVPGNGCTEWHLGTPRSTTSWGRWQGPRGPHGEPFWRGSPGKQPAPGGKASYVNQREMSNVSPHDCRVIRGRAALVVSKRLILTSRRLVFCCKTSKAPEGAGLVLGPQGAPRPETPTPGGHSVGSQCVSLCLVHLEELHGLDVHVPWLTTQSESWTVGRGPETPHLSQRPAWGCPAPRFPPSQET